MDWIRLLDDYQIPYLTRGPNVSKNSIGIKCPFCGDEDPSTHMNISLVKDAYGCWRHSGHGGHAPYRLIQALLGVSYPRAKLVTAQYTANDPDTLGEALAGLTSASKAPKPVEGHEVIGCVMPQGFRPITNSGSGQKYYQYLRSRQFAQPRKVIQKYNLLYHTTGRWKERIIFPLEHGGQLIGWTARSIHVSEQAPRYLSTEAIKGTIFNYDELKKGGKSLIITEGPFDAMKFDYYGKCRGVRATCTFGTQITIGQFMLLRRFADKFKRMMLVFDDDAFGATMTAQSWLLINTLKIAATGHGDPGAMSDDQIFSFMHGYGLFRS